MNRLITFIASVIVGLLAGVVAGADPALPTPEHPTGWRNDGTGHYPGATPPTEWSQALANGAYDWRNIAWKVRVPFHSASSPIVVGDKVFLTGSGTYDGSPMDLMCIDSRTGKVLWMRTLTHYHTVGDAEKARLNALRVDIDAAGGRNIFLVASRKLEASSATEGNCQVAGAKVVKAELLGASGRVVKLTLAEPLTPGQALTVELEGVKSEDGQVCNARLNGAASPGRPVTRELIDDYLIGEVREKIDMKKVLDQDLIGEATTQPAAGAAWKPVRSHGIVDLIGVVGQKSNTIAYACVYLYSETPQAVQLWLGSNAAIKAVVNGTAVHKNLSGDRMRIVNPGDDKVKNIELKQGWNQVLLGLGVVWTAHDLWCFGMRVLDKDGQGPPRGVYYSLAGNGTADLTAVYRDIALIPEFAPVQAAAKPLADKLQAMDDELAAKVNDVSARSRTTLYPTEFPLNWPGVTDENRTAWTSGPPAGSPQANASEVSFDKARKDLASQLNKLMTGYDRVRYKPQGGNQFGYASATPCSDGSNVYVYFANRIAACFDLDGNCTWATVCPDVRGWGASHGTHGSGFLADGKFVIPYGSNVLAVDCKTGERLWGEGIQWQPWAEEGIGYSSLALARVGKESVAIVSSGQGISLATGRTVWGRLNAYAGENTSPVVQDGMLFTFERSGIRATPVPATMADGTKLESKAWIKSKDITDNATEGPALSYKGSTGVRNYGIASPLIVDGLIYCVNDQGVLIVVDIKENKIVYKRVLDVKIAWPGLTASPALAGGYIYIMDSQGTTLVVKPGRAYQQVAANVIESLYDVKGTKERFLASPAFAGNRIFIRGEQYLYCIGK